MLVVERDRRRRVRWFFAGLLIVNAGLNVLGAVLIQHQARTEFLSTLIPSGISLGGRTGVVMSSLALLFLAGGVARGKRVAWQMTCLVLVASVAFDIVKDLDFEGAALALWILCGLWWLRTDFEADSNPASMKRGLMILGAGVLLAIAYAVGGALLLGGQLSPGFGVERSVEHLAESMLANPAEYHALTERADWFLGSLPIIGYGLVLIALSQLLRPTIAPYAAASDREAMRDLLSRWGRNRISHLAIHRATSFYRPDQHSCVGFTLHGRTALVLGEPLGDPAAI